MQGATEQWIVNRRQDYQAGYIEALTCLADYEVRCGRTEHALSLYHKAVIADVKREEIHRIILTMYQQQGRGSEVVAHYRTMIDKLKEIGQKPTPELKQFVDGLLKQ